MKTHHKLRSFDGSRLAYRVWGEPTSLTPIVFCSGIACDDLYWNDLAPRLSKERLVITWDYPYHGDSGPPGDENEIRVESLARHAWCIVEKVDPNPAAFIGHSMGVQVAFECFRQNPIGVASIITIAGPYAHTVGHLYGSGVGYYLLSILEAGSRLNPEVARMAWNLAMGPTLADPLGRIAGLIGHAPPEKMAHYFEHLRRLPPRELFQMFRAGHEHSAEDLLEKINVPTLVIHGTADVMSPFRLAEEMAARIPNAELASVEGGAHTLPIEDPDGIFACVHDFLRARVDA